MDQSAEMLLRPMQQSRQKNFARHRFLVLVFFSTIIVSSSLLFWVQPLFGKLLLPKLGGAPSVWCTVMMLFQALLLAGYTYAHLLARCLTLKKQFLLHGIV